GGNQVLVSNHGETEEAQRSRSGFRRNRRRSRRGRDDRGFGPCRKRCRRGEDDKREERGKNQEASDWVGRDPAFVGMTAGWGSGTGRERVSRGGVRGSGLAGG